jgi:flagellum-specific peptidoglycan hydrolase FlgJ
VVVTQHFPSQKTTEKTVVETDSTAAFINSIGDTASQIGQEYNLHASVLIAQAVLESSNGRSALSQAPYYNLFGIKGAYDGNFVTMATWEDDGAGNVYQIDADFRSYPSYTESLYDYASLLTTDTYAGAWKSNTVSYADATAALTGLYATDTSYADKLNAIIESYGLTAYDTGVAMQDSDYVWNDYRGAYTDAETLEIDQAWAAMFQ